MQNKIKVAIAGVGNCASALVQGVEFYRNRQGAALHGIMHPLIGGYGCSDIEFVAAFDVDARKIGRPLEEAIFAKPNCTLIFQSALPVSNVIVQAGPVLDGIAAHMADYPDDVAFRSADLAPTDIAEALRASKAEVLLCYLPVGSERAVKHYAQACLDARVAMINCIPVFLASDPEWARRFRDAGLPIIGDDVKSQVGATIVHRALARLFADRGVGIERTYQLNTGGNTDFLNMLDRGRLKSKRISKTEAVQSQLDEQLEAKNIHIGPSDYVPWQRDNKVCFIRIEGYGFGDAPIELELRLSVQELLEQRRCGDRCDPLREACARAGRDGPARSTLGLLYEEPAAPAPRQRRAGGLRRLHRRPCLRSARGAAAGHECRDQSRSQVEQIAMTCGLEARPARRLGRHAHRVPRR